MFLKPTSTRRALPHCAPSAPHLVIIIFPELHLFCHPRIPTLTSARTASLCAFRAMSGVDVGRSAPLVGAERSARAGASIQPLLFRLTSGLPSTPCAALPLPAHQERLLKSKFVAGHGQPVAFTAGRLAQQALRRTAIACR